MSPKQQRGTATVELALDAALRSYAEAGEAGLTVGALTKASGLSPGSLYHHFGSLDGLVATLNHRWLQRLLEHLTSALARTRTAHTGIRALVGAYLGFAREHPTAAHLIHSARADQHAMAHARTLRDSQEARIEPLASWLAARVESGELAPLPLPLLESLVLGPTTAVARRWLTLGDIDLDEATRALSTRIWHAVRA